MIDAYLVMWHESSDEIHCNLYNEDSFNKIKKANDEGVDAFGTDKFRLYDKVLNLVATEIALESFFTQTYCSGEWPFMGYNIKKYLMVITY